jgi:hypothetical protein
LRPWWWPAGSCCWLTADDELEAARQQEPTLKATYRNRLAQAVNLSELRKQKLQVQEYVTQLEKQLPGKAEMDALLSDINQAGLGRGLQFELFRPGQVQVKDYYAELPIAIRVSGPLPRRRLLRGRRGQPVAHRHPAEPEHHALAGADSRAAGHGSHGSHLPLPGRCRDRRTAQGRSRQSNAAEPRNERRRIQLDRRPAGWPPCAGRLQRRTRRTARMDGAAAARGQAEACSPLQAPKKFDPQPYQSAQAVEPVQPAEADRRPQAGGTGSRIHCCRPN